MQINPSSIICGFEWFNRIKIKGGREQKALLQSFWDCSMIMSPLSLRV